MINSNFLTNELAQKVAVEVCKPIIINKATVILRQMLIDSLKEAAKEDDKKLVHDALFNALFKAINPYEKKFETMVKGIWDEERRIIASNLKKMKKAWLHKDKVDSILYPVAVFEKKLANGAKDIIMEVMTTEGKRVVSLYGFDMIFDVNNPKVQEWLESYTPMFSKKLEEVNVTKLRAELIEGTNAGEGVPELVTRIYDTYDDWGFRRAKDIAQNQVLRASNRAALNVYRQSGVVKKKIWITHFSPRTCAHCEQLDGTIIGLESNFFDLGDISKVEVEGKEQLLKIDYEEIAAPPLHNRGRCTVGAYIED